VSSLNEITKQAQKQHQSSKVSGQQKKKCRNILEEVKI
jgi:hypothetical protein